MTEFSVVVIVSSILLIIILLKTARIVPQKSEFVIERLGKYNKVLEAGFHVLFPFLDVVK